MVKLLTSLARQYGPSVSMLTLALIPLWLVLLALAFVLTLIYTVAIGLDYAFFTRGK